MNTPRGITLSGTFVQPVDSRDAVVLFSHSFLADRHSGGHFDDLARAYRKAGYATLQFDYSGHGLSDDEVISRESQIEDLQAASGWLADQGFTNQLIHGHSFGSVTALAARLSLLVGACPWPSLLRLERDFLKQSAGRIGAHGPHMDPRRL